jgi:hypothetical protein
VSPALLSWRPWERKEKANEQVIPKGIL